jgi:hypothetical protein
MDLIQKRYYLFNRLKAGFRMQRNWRQSRFTRNTSIQLAPPN